MNIQLLRSILLALALFLPVQLSAQPAAVDAQHTEAVRRMLKVTNFGEIVISGLKQAIDRRATQEQNEYHQFVSRELMKITPDMAVDRMVPIYVRHISAADATAVADFFETPAGGRLLANILSAARGERSRTLPGDVPVISAFERSAAAKAWVAAGNSTKPELQESMKNWGQEIISERLSTDPSAMGAFFAGNPKLRQIIELVRGHLENNNAIEKKYNQAVDRLAGQAMLSAENLTSASKLGESRTILDETMKAVEEYLASVADLQKTLRDRVRDLIGNDPELQEYYARFEMGVAKGLEFQLNFGENQRSMFNLFRGMLDFAESRQDAMSVRNGRIVFQNESDFATFESLIARIREHAAAEEKMLAQAKNTRARLDGLMGDFSRAKPPAAPQPAAATPAPPVSDTPSLGPRRRFVTARTASPAAADYVKRLLSRLRQRMVAELGVDDATGTGAIVTVSVLTNGMIERVTVNRSSGDKASDDALVEMIRRSAPFDAFTSGMRQETDILSITSSM